MPELPDVVGMKRYLDSTSLHQKITHTQIRDDRIVKGCSVQMLYRRLHGAKMTGTVQHGKFLFADLSADGWLVLHFGMTGSLAYYSRDEKPPEYTRMLIDFAGGAHLAYLSKRMLGRLSVADDPQKYLDDNDVGPDALSDEVTADRFIEAMSERRGALKPALMDQSLFSGLGNIYSDEVLFQAGLHPRLEAADLDTSQLRKLYKAMRTVLKAAAEEGGDISGFGQWLVNHRGKGKTCPRCGTEVKSISIAGRRGWFCPECQRKS